MEPTQTDQAPSRENTALEPVDVDWCALANSRQMGTIARRRRRCSVVCLAVFAAALITVLALSVFARTLMGTAIVPGLYVSYVVTCALLALELWLTRLYQRWLERELDPILSEVRATCGGDAR